MSRVQLFLNSGQSVYYPGNVISGHLECYFNNEKNVRGIKIKCTGKERTEWVETESHYNSQTKKHETRHVTYYGENFFLKNEINLLGTNENVLQPGKHTYTFSFTLPNALPSTFEINHGKVAYRIKAIVDRPWKTDYTAEIFFIVVAPIDLNLLGGELRQSISCSDDKTMCCCFCKSGPLTLTITLPKRGYAPGENLNFSAHIENLSNFNVTGLKFQFYQAITLKTTHPSTKHKEERNYLGEIRERGVGAHGDYVFQLEIPIEANLLPPNFTNCKLFEVVHFLKAIAEVPSPHTNLSVKIPIKFGHVPLMERTNQNFQQTTTVPYPNENAPPYPVNMPMPFPQGSTNYFNNSQPSPSAPRQDAINDMIKVPMIPQSTIGGAPSAPEAPPPSYEEIIDLIVPEHQNIGSLPPK